MAPMLHEVALAPGGPRVHSPYDVPRPTDREARGARWFRRAHSTATQKQQRLLAVLAHQNAGLGV